MASQTPQSKLFSRQDIMQLLADEGYDDSTLFMEQQGYLLISELAQNFVEQLLDTYKFKKKDISVNDVKKAVLIKFPEVYVGDVPTSGIVQQNVGNALDEIQERVRDLEKKFNQ